MLKKKRTKTVELSVSFNLTKSLEDYESVKIQGGITIPIQINGDEEYEKAYRHWLQIIRKEVTDQTYKYFRAVQKTKLENLNGNGK